MNNIDAAQTPFIWAMTLTGADESVDPRALAELSEKYPLIEWGILFSPSAEGRERYPQPAWRRKLLEVPVSKSAHLCGQAVAQFIAGDAALLAELESYGRIQLNFSARRMRPEALEALALRIEAMPTQSIIVQQHPGNSDFWPRLSEAPNVQALFDSSGGKGLAPTAWQAPVPGIECGYAGGLSPLALSDQILAIRHACQGQRVWIDMESSLRSGPNFDLGLATAAAAATSPFALSQRAKATSAERSPIKGSRA